MAPAIKKVVGIALALCILGIAYYGSYLPLKKSKAFIQTLRSLSTARSFGDFTKAMSIPLNIPSPIGQEELVRNLGNIVLGVVERSGSPPELIAGSIEYLESYYRPIIERGRGMSFSQNLYLLGVTNQLAFANTKQIKYFEAAKRYYEDGLRLGPGRPQFLYGVFDIYRTENNVPRAKQVGEQILSQWPQDERARRGLEDFLKTRSAP